MMVSTRGTKFKFAIGEKVLCYEPDPTKAKVLYDSKVLDCVEGKDKKGHRVIEYLIHFQGWNSSWDRKVNEHYVLKDTDKNRQLQRDLAEKSQLQIGAYLYRKERKKRKREVSSSSSQNEAKHPFRASSDDGSSCCSLAAGGMATDESDFMETNTLNQNIDHESESCGSSIESSTEEDRVALQISDHLKQYLEYDHDMITKQNKLVILPAKIPVVAILENFVKYYSIKSICGPVGTEGPRRRNSSAKTERREKDYDKIKININLRKEVADGLRIYFDFLLKDYLLYNQEREQANTLLSTENLSKFSYTGSEQHSLDVMLRQGTPNITVSENIEPHQPTTVVVETPTPADERAAKRRLRSHKTAEENEFIFDLGAAVAPLPPKPEESIASNSSSAESTTTSQLHMTHVSSLTLLRNLLPVNMAVTSKTRELLQNILAWQILPSGAPAEPSMIYGSVHLSRLVVKIPDFLNAIPMPDEKLKLLLQYLDCFIEFLETHHDWFGENQYSDADQSEASSSTTPNPFSCTNGVHIKNETTN